jgi:WD40 repeat protein
MSVLDNLKPYGPPVVRLQMTPDRTKICLLTMAHIILVYDMNTGTKLWQYQETMERSTETISMTVGNRVLLLGVSDLPLRRFDITTGVVSTWTAPVQFWAMYPPVINEACDRFILCTTPTMCGLYSLTTGNLEHFYPYCNTVIPDSTCIFSTAISSRGHVAFAASTGGPCIFHLNVHVATLNLQEGLSVSLTFSPDGRYLVITGKGVYVYDVNTGDITVLQSSLINRTYTCAIAPNSRWLFVATNYDETTLYDMCVKRVVTIALRPALCEYQTHLFSDDSSYAMSVSRNGNYCVLPVYTGAKTLSMSTTTDNVEYGCVLAVPTDNGIRTVFVRQRHAELVVKHDPYREAILCFVLAGQRRRLGLPSEVWQMIWNFAVLG